MMMATRDFDGLGGPGGPMFGISLLLRERQLDHERIGTRDRVPKMGSTR